jgi:Protein of unknown function (DUF2934)
MKEKVSRGQTQDDKRSATATAEPLEILIRQRAYELYLERGDRPGSALEDWLRAQSEACAR